MSEKIAFKQIIDQSANGNSPLNSERPTVLVRRSDGTISAGNMLTMGAGSNKAVIEVFTSQGMGEKFVPVVELSDEHQQALAAELAGKALRTLSYDQVNQQNTSAYISSDPEVRKQNPTVLVRRSDGTISTGNMLPMGAGTNKAIIEIATDEGQAEKIVDVRTLSDEHQAYLADELASTRVANLEVTITREDRLNKLKESLSPSDLKSLNDYVNALQDKKQAQRAGNAEGSLLHGQRAGKARMSLSPNALAVASEYAALISS